MELNPKISQITLFVPDSQRREEFRKILAKRPDIPTNVVIVPDKLQGFEPGPIIVDDTDALDAYLLKLIDEPCVLVDYNRKVLGSFDPSVEPIVDRLTDVPVAQSETVVSEPKSGQALRRERRKYLRAIAVSGPVLNSATTLLQSVKGRKAK